MKWKPTKRRLADFPKASESCDAMEQLVAQHLAAHADERLNTNFAKWICSLPQFKNATQRRPGLFPVSPLIDSLAIAINRYINFDPGRDVETEKQAEDWREASQAYEALIIKRNYMHPDPETQARGRQFLRFMATRPRDPDRAIKNDDYTRRRLLVRTLTDEIRKRTGLVDVHVVSNLAAIVDYTIDPGYVRRQLAPITQKIAVRHNPETRITASSTVILSKNHFRGVHRRFSNRTGMVVLHGSLGIESASISGPIVTTNYDRFMETLRY